MKRALLLVALLVAGSLGAGEAASASAKRGEFIPNLDGLANKITSGVDRVAGHVTKHVDEIEGKISGAVGQLKSKVDEMAELARSTFANVATLVDKTGKRFKALTLDQFTTRMQEMGLVRGPQAVNPMGPPPHWKDDILPDLPPARHPYIADSPATPDRAWYERPRTIVEV